MWQTLISLKRFFFSDIENRRKIVMEDVEAAILTKIVNNSRRFTVCMATSKIYRNCTEIFVHIYKTFDEIFQKAFEENIGNKIVWENIIKSLQDCDFLEFISKNEIENAISKCTENISLETSPKNVSNGIENIDTIENPLDMSPTNMTGNDKPYFFNIVEAIKKNIDISAIKSKIVLGMSYNLKRAVDMKNVDKVIVESLKNLSYTKDIEKTIVKYTDEMIMENTEESTLVKKIVDAVMRYIKEYWFRIEFHIAESVEKVLWETRVTTYVECNKELINKSIKCSLFEASNTVFKEIIDKHGKEIGCATIKNTVD